MKPFYFQLSKIILVIGLVFLVSSCGYKDIDKRAFVVTIGVDKAESEDKKYKVMLKIAIPPSDIKAGKPEAIISEYESNSMSDAVRMIKTKVDKELDFSHAKAIIFGESVLEEDIGELLDWFIRRRDIQKIAWVGIGRPNSEEILKLNRKVERLPANSLFMTFGNTGTESVYIVSEYLFDMRRRITEKGIDPILPIIEEKEQKYFQINRAAVLDSKKIRLILVSEETKVLKMLMNRVKKMSVEVKKSDETEESAFFLSVDDVKVTYKMNQNIKNEPNIEVNVELEGIIEEDMMGAKESNVNEYKKMAEEQVRDKVVQLLEKLQEEKIDPIGFGLKYRANSFDKDDWEKWQELYPNVEFEVNVKVTIHGTGLLS